MRTTRLAILLLSALATLAALAPAPASAGARPGERYDGTGADGNRSHLVVSRDGRRLERYSFAVDVRCSNGEERTFTWTEPDDPPIVIDNTGAFAFVSDPYPSRLSDGRRGRFWITVDGRFDEAGESVSGTMSQRFEGSGIRCSSGDVPFTLHLDGTPNAPFTTSTMWTGRYRARTSRAEVLVENFVPGRELSWVRVRFAARCRSGLYFQSTHRDAAIRVRRDSFVAPYAYRSRVRGGGTIDYRARLSGRFFVAGDGRYAFAGVWNVRAVFRVRGRRDVCRLRSPYRGVAD